MFRDVFQTGFLSILYSVGNSPLQIWKSFVEDGQIRRVADDVDVQSSVLELSGSNVATTFITCPPSPEIGLGIKLPFLVMIVKNLAKYFTFEIQILDDQSHKRRFRASNFQHIPRVKPDICTMPLRLDSGWNRIQLHLPDLVKKAYGTGYVETVRVQIHANCRLRRVYFSDKLYRESDLPAEFKLYAPPCKAEQNS